jgi:hypothetical protein
MITVNPVLTTNADNTFKVSLDGFIQGMAMDDPAVRYQLTGGQLAAGQTDPMFGGIPIYEQIPPLANPMDRALQNLVLRATAGSPASGVPTPLTAGLMTGISVFNQNHAMLNSVQSPVPAAFPGMLVNFYRFGSRARIPLAMDPAMDPTAPPSGSTYQGLTWNVANNWVSNAAPAAGILLFPPTVKLIDYNIGNSMTVVYSATTGFALWNRTGSCALLEI